jgi:hypothetical protein
MRVTTPTAGAALGRCEDKGSIEMTGTKCKAKGGHVAADAGMEKQ